jgi:hypothetical protein
MEKNYTIVVDMTKNCSTCKGYHYTVMVWTGKTWVNSGMCGIGATPEKAFSEGNLWLYQFLRDEKMNSALTNL